MIDIKKYRPAGPVMRAFHESSAFFRVMSGPVGSGKTAGAGCVEMLLGCMVQRPHPDGVRRAKFGVLRDTYRNLYSQFIPSWHEWFPKGLGDFIGSDDRPAFHDFRLETPVGPCELKIEMRAIGTNSVEKTLRGWNLTGLFIDEADLVPEDVFDLAASRVKRWPAKPFRVSKGIWGTFNKPDEDHHLFRRCVEEPGPDWAWFDQPPGLIPGTLETNPAAENLERLDDDYYQVQARNPPPNAGAGFVKRMVRNEWGVSTSGAVIYPEFSTERHVLPTEIEPARGTVIEVGVDGGGTPAAVFGATEPSGRRVIYAELVLTDPSDPKGRTLLRGVGAKRLGAALMALKTGRFAGCHFRVAHGDMAAFYGIDREQGELSVLETAFQMAGIPLVPSESNEIALRLDAVRALLATPPGERDPFLKINPSCVWLRRGFISKYKWTEVDDKQPGKKLTPQKTNESHVHDGLQYFCLGSLGRAGVQNLKHDRGAAFGARADSPVPGFRETASGLVVPNGWRGDRRQESYGSNGGEQYSGDWSPWD